MKKVLFIASFLCTLLFLSSIIHADTTIISLISGKSYSIDLNGGASETIFYSKTGYDDIQIYVNGKQVFHDNELPVTQVRVVDIQKNDKFKEIVLEYDYGSACEFTILRYGSNKKIKKLYTTNHKYWEKPDSFDGNGNVQILRWGGNYTLGSLFYYVTGKLSSKNFKIAKQNNCKIQSIGATLKNGWYTTARKLDLYKSSSKKRKTATLKSGTKIKALAAKVSGSNYYVKVKTSDGKKGWIYFPQLKEYSSNSYYLVGGRYS